MSEPPLIDLRPDHWGIVREILHKHVPDREVWAFGSRAKWTAKHYSDLDLCILGDEPLDLAVLAGLEEDFSESDLPFKVDVVDWATTAEGFRGIIERDRVVVQPGCVGDDGWISTTIGGLLLRDGGSIKTGPFGTTLKANEYSEDGVPIISVGEVGYGSFQIHKSTPRAPYKVVERLPEYVLKTNDIVFGRKGAVDRSAIVKPEQAGWFLGSDGIRLRLPTTCIALFIAYQLQNPSVRSWLFQHATGTTMASLNQSTIERIPITLPPLPEQRAIAHILGALDDKIELNSRMNATLEAMARAVFKDWFVDFGPVRAKAEGRPAYLAPEIWDLFPYALDDEDKPVGWISSPLAGVADLNPREKLIKGDPAPYLEMSALPTGGSWPEPPVLRPFEAGSKFRNGDTLLARITPCLENGKTAFIHCLENGQVGWGSTEFIVIRPRKPFPEEFGYLLARDPLFREFAIQSMTGTSGRQRVQVDSLAGYEVIAPRTVLLSSFGAFIKPWFAQIKANAEESQTLAQLRDLLLPKLITGAIQVKDAEKSVEEVL